MNLSTTESLKISDQIFKIPVELYSKLLVLHAIGNKPPVTKNIKLQEYQYENIQLPLLGGKTVKVGIGLRQHIPSWVDQTRERFVTEYTFCFWKQPQRGAPEGYVDVFDTDPMIKITTEKIHDSHSREGLRQYRYEIDKKQLDVALFITINTGLFSIRANYSELKMITAIMKDFEEVRALASQI